MMTKIRGMVMKPRDMWDSYFRSLVLLGLVDEVD